MVSLCFLTSPSRHLKGRHALCESEYGRPGCAAYRIILPMELGSGSNDDGPGGYKLVIGRVGVECVFHLLRYSGLDLADDSRFLVEVVLETCLRV
jgi:hypothetical protein